LHLPITSRTGSERWSNSASRGGHRVAAATLKSVGPICLALARLTPTPRSRRWQTVSPRALDPHIVRQTAHEADPHQTPKRPKRSPNISGNFIASHWATGHRKLRTWDRTDSGEPLVLQFGTGLAYRCSESTAAGGDEGDRRELMKSKLRLESRKALLAANQRLRPEQRVQASVAQSRVIAYLQEVGRRLRERAR
jgi:hypothetical protein